MINSIFYIFTFNIVQFVKVHLPIIFFNYTQKRIMFVQRISAIVSMFQTQ